MSDLPGTIPPDTMRPIRDPVVTGHRRPRRRHVLRWVILGIAIVFVALLATVADGYLQALNAGRELRTLVPLLQGAREDLVANQGGSTRLDQAEAAS